MVTTEPAYWFPASVTLSGTISFPVKIKNNLGTVFSDSLDIYVAVDTGAIFSNLVVVHVEPNVGDSIVGFDTIIKAVNNVYVDPLIFQEGNNTVVIWPIYPNPGGPPTDSLFNTTYAYLGIPENVRYEYPAPYPNPTEGVLSFKRLKQPIEEVRIYGPDGKHIALLTKVSTINLSNYAPGVYYLQYMHEGRMIITRIIKS
ncbi:MAG: T9SS type A sorting domain-containing protein [Flavobacteriales bacterium]